MTKPYFSPHLHQVIIRVICHKLLVSLPSTGLVSYSSGGQKSKIKVLARLRSFGGASGYHLLPCLSQFLDTACIFGSWLLHSNL